jgi:hypothetical protein
VDNRTAYLLDEKTMRYRQTEYMSNMLSRTKKACGSLLQDVWLNMMTLIVANDEQTNANWKRCAGSRIAVNQYSRISRVTSCLVTRGI